MLWVQNRNLHTWRHLSALSVRGQFVEARAFHRGRFVVKLSHPSMPEPVKRRSSRAQTRDELPSEPGSPLTPQPRRKRSGSTAGNSRMHAPSASGTNGAAPKEAAPEFEFMGPPGAFFIMLTLPLFVYILYLTCAGRECLSLTGLLSGRLPTVLSFAEAGAWDLNAMLVVAGWIGFQALLYMFLPFGKTEKGVKLSNGEQLDYKCNGFAGMVVTLVVLAVGSFSGLFPLSYAYHHYCGLITGSIVISWALSIYLYASSFSEPAHNVAHGGNTGNAIYDFFIGRPLNPRIFGGTFDLKFFCELRPGLIGWMVLNLSMAAAQYEKHNTITVSMVLVNFFQAIYVIDALFVEKAILTTMDIVHDGFGFMLVFGDLVWVPFTYGLQARYLVDHPVELSWWATVAILTVNFLGYYIFRASNLQKNIFRTNPKDPRVAHLETIDTKRGTKLLATGWWGWSRHINYFGDWLMSVAWCLPCGFGHALPYFYPAYFAVLLIHRQQRDDHNCGKKYGKDWDKYCKKVPWRIVPYVY